MKLTLLGHREGARVPPEYVGKCRSPLDSVAARGPYTHLPRKSCRGCLPYASRIDVHSRLFGFGSGRAGLTYAFPSITAIMCGVYTPDPILGSMHDFASSPFLDWTSPRAPGAGLKDQISS